MVVPYASVRSVLSGPSLHHERLSLLLQSVYCAIDKSYIRTASVFSLVAAGIYSFGGACLFYGFHGNLMAENAKGEESLMYPPGVCLLSGLIAIAAAAVTAAAIIKMAKLRDAFDLDSE
ncbi:hypothetical protein ScPMuIL_016151 [Solemya velum]